MEKPFYRADLPGEIRKITFFLKNEFIFTVGQETSNLKITKIERDENNSVMVGMLMYRIYAKQANGEEFVWKTLEGIPCVVEYFI